MAETMVPREHLSDSFPEILPGSVFSKENTVREDRPPTEMTVQDLWRVERDTPHRHGEAAIGFALLSARLYDQNLTIDPMQKEAFGAIREELSAHPGEIAAVLVTRRNQEREIETAYCYTGILPEEIEFKNDAYKDTVAVPGARGFRLLIGRDIMDLGGDGPRDVLPLSLSPYGPNGFSLIPERYTETYADHPESDQKVSEFAKGNTPYLVIGKEIPAKILEEYSQEMAAELMIQIAEVIREIQPEKVPPVLGGIVELAEPLANVRQLVNDYKTFYESVVSGNADFRTQPLSLEQLEGAYNTLRIDYQRRFQAIREQYANSRSIIQHQIIYERTRTWPFIDFADQRPDAFHSPKFALGEMERETTELQDRIERANKVLNVLDLLTEQDS